MNNKKNKLIENFYIHLMYAKERSKNVISARKRIKNCYQEINGIMQISHKKVNIKIKTMNMILKNVNNKITNQVYLGVKLNMNIKKRILICKTKIFILQIGIPYKIEQIIDQEDINHQIK